MIATAFSGLLLLILGFSAAVSAAAPDPVTDYANYPAPLPAGCPDSAGIVDGEQYTINGQTADNLASLPAPLPGSTVTMTWSSFAAGCPSDQVGIGLSVKISLSPSFVEADLQHLAAFGYCGPEGPVCAAPFQISFVMPAADLVPCWQLDAHIGPPLAVVGPQPDGSFYSGVLNGSGQTMLISAQNGGTEPCAPPPCPSNPAIPAGALGCTPVVPCPTNPDLPADSPDCQPPPRPCALDPNLPADSPQCVPCSSNPNVTPSSPQCDPCPTNPNVQAGSPECQPAPRPTTPTQPAPKCTDGFNLDPGTNSCVAVKAAVPLPFTGSRSYEMTMAGGLLLMVGSALLAFVQRLRRV
ncbi:MAG: hypothetical protein OEY23_16550 [Acidimicrobiia bacterium]|nr:hypothetical protein [Acidimicrobiia bacterium]